MMSEAPLAELIQPGLQQALSLSLSDCTSFSLSLALSLHMCVCVCVSADVCLFLEHSVMLLCTDVHKLIEMYRPLRFTLT